MGSSILNTANALTGTTFTPAAGSNRRVVTIGHVRRDTGTPIYSATLGGVAMTADLVGPLNGDDQLLVFSMLDANIPAGSPTLSVTATGGTILDPFHGQIWTLGGVDQTALDTGFTSNGTSTATVSATTASLTNQAGSVLMAGVRNSSGDAISAAPSGWTADRLDTSQGGLVWLGQEANASAATATYTWTSVSNNWMWVTVAYLAASVAPPASTSPLGGKCIYVMP